MAVLGIHLEKNILTTALVEKTKGELVIHSCEKFFLNENGDLKELKNFLELLLIKKKEILLVSGLGVHDVLIKSLEIPLRGKRAVWNAIPFQLEGLLPYPLEETLSIALFHNDKKNTNGTQISFFSTHSSSYEAHKEKLSSFNIDPHLVSSVAAGLYRFASVHINKDPCIAIHMDEWSTYLISIKEGFIEHSFEIDIGIQDCAQELLAKELDKILFFLAAKKENEEKKKILLLRGKELLRPCIESLNKEISLAFELVDIDQALLSKWPEQVIAIGLAMDVLAQDEKSLQFTPFYKTHPGLIKRLMKRVGSYALSSLLLCALAAGSFFFILKEKEKSLNRDLSSIIEDYEHEFFENRGKVEKLPFKQRLTAVQKSFALAKKPYNYYLMPLGIKQLLSEFFAMSAGKDNRALLLEEMDYELSTYPTLKAPLDPYELKVRLFFKAPEEGSFEEAFEKMIKQIKHFDKEAKSTVTPKHPFYEVFITFKLSK